MADFNSKYTGEQVEEMLDRIANGEAGGGGGGITIETDPIFLASPAASITNDKISTWDKKQDAITDLNTIRQNAEDGESAYRAILDGDVLLSDDVAEVAFSGNYNDLLNKPTIPSENQLLWTKVEGEAGVRLKGTNGTATGNLAISAGDDKTASDGTAFASIASGDHAVVFGFGNTCAGRSTLAQGLYNIVNGKDSVAFGQRNLVNGDQAFAAGQQNEVATRLGVAIGYKNKATNTDSIAIGYQNTSSGSASVAMGDTCEATGTSSTAMGYKTKATGAYTSTFGQSTQATNTGEVAMGLFNKSTTSTEASEQTLFSFGIGTSDTNRVNAFEIKKNGDVYIGDNLLTNLINVRKEVIWAGESSTIEVMSPNVIYWIAGGYNNITINSFEELESEINTYDVFTLMFEIGDLPEDEVSLTLPEYVKWANGIIPELTKGEYELSISRISDGEYTNYYAVLTPFKLIES